MPRIHGRAPHQALELRPDGLDHRDNTGLARRPGLQRFCVTWFFARNQHPGHASDAQRRHRLGEPDRLRIVVRDREDLVGGQAGEGPAPGCSRNRGWSEPRAAPWRAWVTMSSFTSTWDVHRRLALTRRARTSPGGPRPRRTRQGARRRTRSSREKTIGLGGLQETVAGSRRGRQERRLWSSLSLSHVQSVPGSEPVTIGTRTALPHSVQDPS